MKNISDFFYNCTEKYADKDALAYGKPEERRFITYGNLREAVERCAFLYEKKGYSGNKKIAILGANSYEWVLNFFAIELTRNVAVLLDKAQKIDDLKQLVKKTEVDCLIYSEGYEEEAKAIADNEGIQRASMKEMSLWDPIGTFQRKNIPGKQEAIIAFTSGTNGTPKGVLLSHRAIISNTLVGAEFFECTGNTILFLPLYHMYGLNTHLLTSMFYGRCVYINSSLRYIPQDLQQAKPDYLLLVPMLMGSVLKLLQGMHASGLPLPKKIVSGGAPIDMGVVENFSKLGVQIYNAYGITECGPGVAISVEPVSETNLGMKCVTEVKIEHPDKNGCGEILVKGASVMDGYYGQPEETKSAFEGGYFHTGDVGFLSAGNMLTITGRIKNLIVLPNGENIAPEELEMGLKSLPMIEDAIVKQEDSCLVAEVYLGKGLTEEKEREVKNNIFDFSKNYPAYKRISKVEIRKLPFEKTSTLKIKR